MTNRGFMQESSVEFALPADARIFAGGSIYITLDNDGIESYDFDTEDERIPWCEIEKASIIRKRKRTFLVLHLKQWSALVTCATPLIGPDPARPTLEITDFSEQDRERIADWITRHVPLAGKAETSRPVEKEQAERPLLEFVKELAERPFQEFEKKIDSLPWAVYSLIAINVVVWIAMQRYGVNSAEPTVDTLLAWGGSATSEVKRGQWWRLLASIFLHGDYHHIVANMVGLYCIGNNVERIYDKRSLPVIYIGSGLIGSALSLHFSAQHSVSIGASGAVFGMAGAILVSVLQHRSKLSESFSITMAGGTSLFIIYSLVSGFVSDGIDNAAHIGGLIGGCVIAWILPERFDMDEFLETRTRQSLTAVALTIAATGCLVVFAPKPAVDIGSIVSTELKLEQGVNRFDEASEALMKMNEDVKSGKLSLRKADEQSRAIHAPLFRQLAEELSQVQLPPGDQRDPLLKDVILVSKLLSERLALESVYKKGDAAPYPADPVRSGQLDKEIDEVNARIKKEMDALSEKKR